MENFNLDETKQGVKGRVIGGPGLSEKGLWMCEQHHHSQLLNFLEYYFCSIKPL